MGRHMMCIPSRQAFGYYKWTKWKVVGLMRVGMAAFCIPQFGSYSSHFQLPGTHSRSSKGEKCAAQMRTKTLLAPRLAQPGRKKYHLFKILQVARICVRLLPFAPATCRCTDNCCSCAAAALQRKWDICLGFGCKKYLNFLTFEMQQAASEWGTLPRSGKEWGEWSR